MYGKSISLVCLVPIQRSGWGGTISPPPPFYLYVAMHTHALLSLLSFFRKKSLSLLGATALHLNIARCLCFLVPAKGPTIKNITSPTSTQLKVMWDELSDDNSNGIITQYRVCYHVTSSEEVFCAKNITVIGKSNTMVTLTALKKATMYDVAVKAATAVGFGDLGAEKNGKTLEDGKCLM